ncbi:hypothetical protein Dimus_024714 [Dionaea muscipula]
MVGRRRASPQKRVCVAIFDSKSPDPHCRGLTRGCPSPAAPHFRRAPPSPGMCKRHRRSPSPKPLSSPKPAKVSSSEEGEATVAAVSSSEDEDHADLEGRFLVSLNFFKSLSVPEESDKVEGSPSATSSDSSAISPKTAVLLCQANIAAEGPVDGGLKLSRADSGYADLLKDSMSMLCSSLPEQCVPSVCGPMVVGGELEADVGGCGGAQCIVMAGEAVSPSVDADDVQCRGIHKVSSSSVNLSSFESALDGGEVNLDVQIPLRQCAQVNIGSILLGSNMLNVSNLLVGSNKLWAVSPLCESPFMFLGGSVGRVGDGLVSEEGRVSSVAREALRSQPADGLRQPPSSAVYPVISAEGGGVHPRLMWSFNSAKHRDFRVRSVVERSMREGMGSDDVDFWPALTDLADVVVLTEDLEPIELIRPDLGIASAGVPLTMADAVPNVVPEASAGRGCEEVLDPASFSDCDAAEMMAALPVHLVVASVGDDAPVQRDVDSEETPASAVGEDGVPAISCFLMGSLAFSRAEPESPIAECPVLPAAVSSFLSSDPFVVGMSPVASALSDSSDDTLPVHSVVVDRVLPFADAVVDSICHLDDVVGSVEGSKMCIDIGGLVSEEVLVSSAASASLRSQPADGLR